MSYDVNVPVVISKVFFFSYQWNFFLKNIEYILEFLMQIKFPWNFNI